MTHRESAGETNDENGDGNQPNRFFDKILAGVRAGSESDMQLLVEFAIDRVSTACQRQFD